MVEKMGKSAPTASKVESQERSHQRPSGADRLTYHRVDIRYRCQSALDRVQRFPPEGGLQPVCQVARPFSTEPDRPLAEALVELERALYDMGAGLAAGHDLDNWYNMRWIEWVPDQHAVRERALLLK
jgi:hypothetical protein